MNEEIEKKEVQPEEDKGGFNKLQLYLIKCVVGIGIFLFAVVICFGFYNIYTNNWNIDQLLNSSIFSNVFENFVIFTTGMVIVLLCMLKYNKYNNKDEKE